MESFLSHNDKKCVNTIENTMEGSVSLCCHRHRQVYFALRKIEAKAMYHVSCTNVFSWINSK